MNGKFIDLHVHTNCSDGFDSVSTVIWKARKNNVRVISLTEHYNMGSFPSARNYAKDIELIPGIEIDSDMSKFGGNKGHVCHILGYFVSTDICRFLDEYEIDKQQCVIRTIEYLQRRRVKITIQDVQYNAKDAENLSRYDVAKALSYLGYATTPQEAYGLYLDHRDKIVVKRKRLLPGDLVKKIIEYGGVPVLAHPKSLNLTVKREKSFIAHLVRCGLRGIEVYNPNNSLKSREHYLSICRKYGLVATVGSDYHGGRRKPEVLIGLGIDNNLQISDMDIVERLKLEKAKIDALNREV